MPMKTDCGPLFFRLATTCRLAKFSYNDTSVRGCRFMMEARTFEVRFIWYSTQAVDDIVGHFLEFRYI